jgi:hypothetical protein
MPNDSENKAVDAPVNAPRKPKPGDFVKGKPGGPGRPKATEDAISRDLLTRIERVVTDGMKKGELADRLKAAGLGIKLKGMKEKKVDEVSTPFVLKLAGLLTDLAGRCSEEPGTPQNALSVIDLMVKTCPTCPLLCSGKDPAENF